MPDARSRIPAFSQVIGLARKLKTVFLMFCLQCVAGAFLHASEFVIPSAVSNGQLTFTEVPGAVSYRVEWSASLAPGSWSSEAPGIASIPAQGSGERTVTVGTPQGTYFYRVVAVTGSAGPSGFQIKNFKPNGQLTFTEVPGAYAYRIEWSATLNPGSWSSEAPGIASIPAQGPGDRTVTVGTGTGPSFFRVVALMQPPPPSGFVLVPEGAFDMGDTFREGDSDERPVHSVTVAAFLMQEKETAAREWSDVLVWALANGYEFDNYGRAKGMNHPVVEISWFDVVKWCNARSEKEGRTPCYYADEAHSVVYRTGRVNMTNAMVKWDAYGYRLPTEAEWEKAARGGASRRRFPWGNTITHAQSNYLSSESFAYDTSPTRGYHPAYATAPIPLTAPVGSFPSTGYGVFDMAGNVWEWCWDSYGTNYYASSPATDPRGPAPDVFRVARGGSWESGASGNRVAVRGRGESASKLFILGFRTVVRP
jgi:formylglycine-generating enzyme required for sulfatase activity